MSGTEFGSSISEMALTLSLLESVMKSVLAREKELTSREVVNLAST